MIDTALHWIDQGIAVIPIGYRSKRPNTRYLHNGQWKEYQVRLPCRGEITEWFGNRYLTNIAIICGWQNLVIVDFDNMEAHDLWRSVYNVSTYSVHTGRGVHYYFYVEEFPEYTMKWAGGEIKASGYCLIPPSVHPSGRHYMATCDNLEIMTIGSIYEIFPDGFFEQPSPSTRPMQQDIYNQSTGISCQEINEQVRIVTYFSNPRRTGNGWYTVQCPLHEDGNHLSGWINDNTNRYGCHACISGSLSMIDFYMRLNRCDLITAMRELSCLM